MWNNFNLDAPILPGKSAAGVSIGDYIGDILRQAVPLAINDLPTGRRYQLGSVTLWVNKTGNIQQIGLYAGYTGKINQSIGIGSSIREITTLFGNVIEDEQDNLEVEGFPGWCFESSPWPSPQQVAPDLDASITQIFIFEANGLQFDDPPYPTKCPQCGSAMRFDLILNERRGVNSSHVSPAKDEDDVLGYGYFCLHCQRGWTGNELLKMAKDRGLA
jgi:hypothetical protein